MFNVGGGGAKEKDSTPSISETAIEQEPGTANKELKAVKECETIPLS
eukprot:CAMPEP_0116995590 /NCGR_PEP_ID=MMETSP0467-20121206/68885_1 /TAXON_ID=283647 /ORGANISM="Mesodinium pulex, Strain SPMC105" /LENGTH=46 /DNA_ID= /DNA_START= /DNA_END= /DNA_ORIENTATION=